MSCTWEGPPYWPERRGLWVVGDPLCAQDSSMIYMSMEYTVELLEPIFTEQVLATFVMKFNFLIILHQLQVIILLISQNNCGEEGGEEEHQHLQEHLPGMLVIPSLMKTKQHKRLESVH